MKIVYVNNTDLLGRGFNGYDLHVSLNKEGHDCRMFVVDKWSQDSSVESFRGNSRQAFVQQNMRALEYELSMPNMLLSFYEKFSKSYFFQQADIIHYHLLHNHVLTLEDMKTAFKYRNSIWTIHDPWVVTAHCIHPLECEKWKTGCNHCGRLEEEPFPMRVDKVRSVWENKKRVFQAINPHIIVPSDFMKQYILQSPLTRHFTNIHKVPFGIETDMKKPISNVQARKYWGIPENYFVIAFRAEENQLKGVRYIFEALKYLNRNRSRSIALLTVGSKNLPESIKQRYVCFELGVRADRKDMDLFYSAANVFLMPSLAESFGMMAIEAMALERPVIVFKQTVLTEITFAPECGMDVPYKDDKALAEAILFFMRNPSECDRRGKLGRKIVQKYYKYSDYISKHLSIYRTVAGIK